MMRALIKETPSAGYSLKEIPIPEPKDDELVFKVEKVNRKCSKVVVGESFNEV